MTLKNLLNVFSDGTACFSIDGLCGEYCRGLDELKREPWYKKNASRQVRNIVIIGGGMYKVEVCIKLED